MNTKLRIKMGSVEVEYEGSDDFLKKELPELLKAVLELHAQSDETGDQESSGTGDGGQKKDSAHKGKISSSTAAVKLKAGSASQLALAAAAALSIGEGKDTFTRADLLRAMKQAKSHYKATYSANLSNAISTLVKNEDLLDQGSNTYALSETKRKDLEKTFAA